MEYFYRKCKENGLKVTPQRIAIYEKLTTTEKHPTAEQLYSVVREKFPNISLDTVNRTLITFAKVGLAMVVEGFGSPRRYDPNMENHHHVHCAVCGKIMDFYNEEYDSLHVPEEIQRKYKIVAKKVVLNGVCEKCQHQ